MGSSRLRSIVAWDITQLYAVQKSALKHQHNDDGFSVRLLDLDELLAYAQHAKNDLSIDAARSLSLSNRRCCAVIDGDTLAAYAFFAAGDVAPSFNSAGAGFGGIGLKLPTNVTYVYKCFALPQYRGRNYLSQVICKGVQDALDDDWLIASTSVKNTSADRLFTKLGFEKKQLLREYRVFGRGVYRMPNTLKLAEQGSAKTQVVELYKP